MGIWGVASVFQLAFSTPNPAWPALINTDVTANLWSDWKLELDGPKSLFGGLPFHQE
jgi:hypothetical protein